MPQVIEQGGSVIGRIGKGIGKGLADQIPKEIDRYRLSSGLDKFAKESKGKSPFQQAVDFYKIPGATAEMGYTLFPLLQNEARSEAASKFAQSGQPNQPKIGKTNAQVVGIEDREGKIQPYRKGEMQNRPIEKRESASLKPSEITKAQITPYVKPTDDQMYKEAIERHRENPQLWKTPEDAFRGVVANEQVKEANFREQQNVGVAQDALKAKVLGDIEGSWTKEKTFNGIPGTMQTRIFENAENELSSGNKTEKQIVKEAKDAGKEIAQAYTNLKSAKPAWYESPKNIRRVIPEIRKTFEKHNGLEEFQDLLAANLDLSPQIAARQTYLLDKSTMKYIDKYFPTLERDILSSLFVENYNQDEQKKGSATFGDAITQLMDEDASVLSFVAEAQKRGYKPQIIIDRLKTNAEAGLWKPNDRQQRELQKVIPDLPTLGDFYLSLMIDEDEMVE